MVKNFEGMLFVLTECTNVTDGHTQTSHDDIGLAFIASRGKNVIHGWKGLTTDRPTYQSMENYLYDL